MTKRILIFANPIAGKGRGQALAEQLADQLRRERYLPQLILDRPDRVGKDQLDINAHMAISIGGDGTVRGVAGRMFELFGEAMPPLLVVPMGTANLLGRHLGTNWSDSELASKVSAAVHARRVIHLDAARANDALFLLMAGIGLDGKVVHELDNLRTGPINFASYALPAAMALGFYKYTPLTVTVDGKTIFKNLPGVAFVGNVKEYGTGFPILPHARPDDGLLDVCILPCSNRAEAIRYFFFAAVGEHLTVEGTIYTRGKSIQISSAEPVPVQIDGEAAGTTPLDINLLPVRLPFILPA